MRIMRTALSAAAAAIALAVPSAMVQGDQCDSAGGSSVIYTDSCNCQSCGGSGGGCTYCWSDIDVCYTDGVSCIPRHSAE